jgi:hypothetical protein
MKAEGEVSKDEQDTLVRENTNHPSRSLPARRRGYGIGGGYEKPRTRGAQKNEQAPPGRYGAIAHGGYYGSGGGSRPFKLGQATFEDEIEWYKAQFGEDSSGFER